MRRKLLLALLCLLCLLPCTSAMAYTTVYTITAEELDQWQSELNLQKTMLQKQKQLEAELKDELGQQKLLLTSSKQALTDANRYLTEYEAEVKRKQKHLETQRTVAWCVVGALAIGFILK